MHRVSKDRSNTIRSSKLSQVSSVSEDEQSSGSGDEMDWERTTEGQVDSISGPTDLASDHPMTADGSDVSVDGDIIMSDAPDAGSPVQSSKDSAHESIASVLDTPSTINDDLSEGQERNVLINADCENSTHKPVAHESEDEERKKFKAATKRRAFAEKQRGRRLLANPGSEKKLTSNPEYQDDMKGRPDGKRTRAV